LFFVSCYPDAKNVIKQDTEMISLEFYDFFVGQGLNGFEEWQKVVVLFTVHEKLIQFLSL
jgi:tRNA (Thr-GGU) A37 N-methylase